MMYSVDYPFYENEGARAFIENAPIRQDTKEKIAHGNAERLLKLSKAFEERSIKAFNSTQDLLESSFLIR